MKKLAITAALAVAAVGLFADAASANHPGPYCATGQCGPTHRWGTFFGKHPMPAFQAAPWYLYWPYNAHFQTPAPLAGPYYAPPYSGGQMVNPYFPAHPGLMPGGLSFPVAGFVPRLRPVRVIIPPDRLIRPPFAARRGSASFRAGRPRGKPMPREKLGELVPVGGGDPVPLTQDHLTIGRRESCDICLKFQNVSSTHCELAFQNGYWMVRDLQSANGTKLKGERISPLTWKPLRPGDEIKIASHRYTIEYTLQNGTALEAALAEEEDIFGQSLMEKAGLEKPKNRPDRD